MSDFYKKSALLPYILASIIICMSASAKAAAVDLGELTPEVTYSIPVYSEVKASYTPSTSGPVKFLWTCSPLTLYDEPVYTQEHIVKGSHSYTDSGQLMTYQTLEEGHTYYIYRDMTVMGGELIIREGDMKLELVKTEPCTDTESPDFYGNKFSITRNYTITLNFNCPVTVGNCFLMAGDERERILPVISNSSVSFDINEIVMDFYHRDILKEGEPLTLRVLQIKDASNPDNKFGENGRLEIEYIMDSKPAELTSTKGFSRDANDNPFRSYYFPGDEAAKMILKFDRELSTEHMPEAQIMYGNPDNVDLGIYYETLNGVVDGNSVAFDFADKLRRRADMLPSADVSLLPDNIYIAFSNIYSADGQRTYSGIASNPTGFSCSYVMQELLYSVAADFTPAKGSAINGGQKVEIWVMNGSQIRYDHICIDYTEDGVAKTLQIDNDAVTSHVDEYSLTGDDIIYEFTLPDFNADENTEIHIYMTGVVCSDGLDHSDDVRGTFNAATSDVAMTPAEPSARNADVYDIAGKLVLREASEQQISALKKGLYICNGKKIIK